MTDTQDNEGNVWCFGEESYEYEDGEAVSDEVSWELGIDGAKPRCIRTEDYTPLEPDILEYKYYVPGLGLILEEDVESGERIEIDSIETD